MSEFAHSLRASVVLRDSTVKEELNQINRRHAFER